MTVTALPVHNHSVMAKAAGLATDMVNVAAAGTSYLARTFAQFDFAPDNTAQHVGMGAAIQPTGVDAVSAHNNMQPYLPMYMQICLNGNYPIPSQ